MRSTVRVYPLTVLCDFDIFIIQWRSQKLCVGGRPEREGQGACVEWGGVWGGVSPLQPTRGPGERRAPQCPVGSGAKPLPQMHFLRILGHGTLLVERKM